MDAALLISNALSLRQESVAAAIALLDEGNTLPFIARYRKEATGGLDDEQLRELESRLGKLRALDERRQTILGSIQEQDKLTPELAAQIQAAETLTALEDLYLPYKPKRRTRASLAREKGLEPLADLILAQGRGDVSPEALALSFLSEAVPGIEEALAGARDIVAETISDHAEVRRQTRERAFLHGSLLCEKVPGAEDPRRVYELYYEYQQQVERLRPHQILALDRGEREKVLRIKLIVPDRDWLGAIQSIFRPDPRSPFAGELQLAIVDAAARLLLPAIERDVRRALTEKAETHAIGVFTTNLRALLTQPPLAGHTIIGLDPGFRTGCKVAVVDPTGKVLWTGVIYPHEPQKQWAAAVRTLLELVDRFHASLISIGNGTASRETEKLAAEVVQAAPEVKYLITNEAGASVYSASELARAELPGMDVSLRGAVSIARRVQDPLAELVKIDPKSIGVGMYQHDVDQKNLSQALSGTVEGVVNHVGVDLNTASPALLTYIAGIGPRLAGSIVTSRDTNGPFLDRQALRKVSGLGPKAFEQCAGFLRIRGGSQPLDATHIHPESYAVAEKLLQMAGVSARQPQAEIQEHLDRLLLSKPLPRLAAELKCGEPTLKDILEQLARPGRDPRQDFPAVLLRSDVLVVEDLQPGMHLKGTVRNVVDFGAFVDIGVKQDGLLHRSRIPQTALLRVGDIIEVEILSIEPDRGRISLGWTTPG
ncbi:MAG TPA: Tex family protein [Anaerolineales bacterium]|nr:Tex family protein [Anaerolineales bacterium]